MTRSKRRRCLVCLGSIALLIGLLGCAPQAAQIPPPASAIDTKPETTSKGPPLASAEQPEPSLAIYQPQSLALIKAYRSQDPETVQKAHAIIDTKTMGKDAALALNILALLALDTQELGLARLYAERATLADPDFDESQLTLGRIAKAQSRYNDALKHYERAAKLNPQRALPNIAAAALLLEFLDLERALGKAQEAVKAEPQNCQAIAILADVYMAQKNFQEATKHYESFLNQANCQINEALLQNLAKIYEVHLQDPKKACQAYQKLLNFSPDNANYKASRDYQCQQQQTAAPSKE